MGRGLSGVEVTPITMLPAMIRKADTEPPRALGLVSGGLDSLLAERAMIRLGFDTRAVYFRTGFAKPARELQLPPASADRSPVRIVDVREPYLEQVVLKPRYGYGSGMNPCVDCRIFMLGQAGRLAHEERIDLLFTGDVIGQRDFDQSRAALQRIDDEAGVAGRVLRPLCAGLLEPTLAEAHGWVDRGNLLRLHGRARAGQFELARQYGLERFPAPSGGCCRLADRGVARRLRDLLSHRAAGSVVIDELELLDVGRHFRLAWDVKVIVGRNLGECTRLARYAGERHWTVEPTSGPGALGLIEGRPDETRMSEVASLVARYSGTRGGQVREFTIRGPEAQHRVRAAAADPKRVERWRI